MKHFFNDLNSNFLKIFFNENGFLKKAIYDSLDKEIIGENETDYHKDEIEPTDAHTESDEQISSDSKTSDEEKSTDSADYTDSKDTTDGKEDFTDKKEADTTDNIDEDSTDKGDMDTTDNIDEDSTDKGDMDTTDNLYDDSTDKGDIDSTNETDIYTTDKKDDDSTDNIDKTDTTDYMDTTDNITDSSDWVNDTDIDVSTDEANETDTTGTSDTTITTDAPTDSTVETDTTITTDETSTDLITDAPVTDENKDRTHVNIKCLFVAKYNVYTLQQLTKDTQYERDVEIGEKKLGKLRFNICKDLPNEKSTMIFEPEATTTSLLTAENNETKQIKLAGSIDGGENGSKNEWKEIDEDDGTKGVKIRLSEGDVCNGNTHHVTYLRIICDDKAKDDLFTNDLNFSRFNERDCVHYIESRSIYGCALNDWYLLRRLVNEYNYIFSTLLILVGLFLLLFGKKFQTPTVIIVGGVLVCYLVTVIILNFIPGLIQTEGHLCILFAVGFILGGVLGYCIKEKVKILSVLMGAFAGYTVGEFIYQFIAGFITSNPIVLYWVVIVICIILGGLIGYWLFNTAIIFGTSIIGGYVAMRGVTFIFGNYMDESEFVDLAKNGETEQLKDIKNGWVYAYLGLWLVLSIVGIYYQCRKHREDDGEKDSKSRKNSKSSKSSKGSKKSNKLL